MDYTALIEEVRNELQEEKKMSVKSKMKERLRKIEKVEEVLDVMKREIKQLAKSGKITDLTDYIKIDEAEGCIVIKRNFDTLHLGTNTQGIHIEA